MTFGRSVFAEGRPANIDARLDASQEALIAQFNSLSVHTHDIPLRPDFGKAGLAIKLRTNFFPVRVPKGPLYEYDIAIAPVQGTSNRRMKRRILQLAEATPQWAQLGLRGRVAHDHAAKLISAAQLPQPLTITVPFYEEEESGPPAQGGKVYTLTLKLVQTLETESLSRYALFPSLIIPVCAALTIIRAATSKGNRTTATTTSYRSLLRSI